MGEKMAKRIYDAEVIGRRTRVWMDGVKGSLRGRGLILEQAKVTVHDRMGCQSMDE